jgi:hypothetical protein
MYKILIALLVWPCIAYATPILTADVALSCEGSEKYFSVDPRYLELENVIGNLTRSSSFVCVAAHIRREDSSAQETISDIVYHEDNTNKRRLHVYIGNLPTYDRLRVLGSCNEWCSAMVYGKIAETGQDDFTLIAERIELER